MLWVFVAVCRFSLVAEGGAIFCCGTWTSYGGGFSCCGAQVLGGQASVVAARGLSGCGTWASLLQGMWHLPGPGITPVSSALACRFLSTVPVYQFEEWVHTVLFWFFLVMNRDFSFCLNYFPLNCLLMQDKEWKGALRMESVTFPSCLFLGLFLCISCY